MKFHHRGIVACVVALLVSYASLAWSTDDSPKTETKKELVPADLKDWTIRFEGCAGIPRERSWFRVSLKYDGTINVQKKQGKRAEFRTILEKKLDETETKQFFEASAAMINGYRKELRRGKFEDGWDLQLTITATSFVEWVYYDDQKSPPGGPPGFDAMTRIISAHLNRETFP